MNTNYRLKVKVGRKWVWGINSYTTYEKALERKEQMEKVGHKVKIEFETKLFN